MSKSKRILIDAVYPEETRVVIHENNRIDQFDYETAAKKQIKGNIYLAKVTRVEPSLQAAFVEYGADKQGFLPFAEIHPDYYQIPVADRQKLMAEVFSLNASERNDDFEEDKNEENDDFVTDEIDDTQESQAERIYDTAIASADGSFSQIEGDAASFSQGKEEQKETIDSETQEDFAVEESDMGVPSRSRGRRRKNRRDRDEEESFGIDEEDEERGSSARHWELLRKYKIQEVIKRNQIILVQVIKEERGNKGATLTTYISLAGRYCVLKPNSPRQGGISRKIGNIEDRRMLRSVLEELNLPQGTSIIIRTAGAGKNRMDIKQDYEYLVRLWNNIREQTLSSSAPAFIHSEGDLIKRTIRDWFDHSIEEVVVQGEEAFRSAKEFVKMTLPDLAANVKHYKNSIPLFTRYRVEEQLAELYSPIAHLKSGGYVVIDPTEALISIDVNSGRSTSERNVEETALKTNLEAAREIARQLRLRDLSGLIVIDFIDMLELRNRRNIERALREAFQRDRAKVQLGRISTFGLMEMSRQRLRSSFYESNTVACPTCEGRGRVRAPESTAIMILRAIESEMSQDRYEEIDVFTAPEVASFIFNFKRDEVATLEKRHDIRIFLHSDNQPGNDTFVIEPKKQATRKVKKHVPLASDVVVSYEEIRTEDIAESFVVEPKEREVREPRGNRERGPNRRNWKNAPSQREAQEEDGEVLVEEERGNNGNRSRRRYRGGNGRRRPRGNPSNDGRRYNEGRRSSYQGEKQGAVASTAEERKESLLKGLWRRILD